jgi:hypothetical protein
MRNYVGHGALEKLFFEIEKHAILRAHGSIILRARKEAVDLNNHAYVWAGSDPFTGEQVLDLLNENERLRNEINEVKRVFIKMAKP